MCIIVEKVFNPPKKLKTPKIGYKVAVKTSHGNYRPELYNGRVVFKINEWKIDPKKRSIDDEYLPGFHFYLTKKDAINDSFGPPVDYIVKIEYDELTALGSFNGYKAGVARKIKVICEV